MKLRNIRKKAIIKSDLARTELTKEKTGIFTGGYAINPVNNEKIPIWIADYVLWGYGTGAIMAVPAHDQRDYEFAKKFDIKITQVIKGGKIDKEAYEGDGIHINSEFINDLNKEDAINKMNNWLEKMELEKLLLIINYGTGFFLVSDIGVNQSHYIKMKTEISIQ